MFTGPYRPYGPATPEEVFTILAVFYSVIGIVLALLGIIGGAFALKKKHWGVALAGAIAGVITFFPCGIAAVIMISMAQP